MAGRAIKTGLFMAALLVWAECATATPPHSNTSTYKPKNGVLNWKAIVLGGGFRVTTAIPLHGDFAKYDRLEIVRTRSLIGRDAPQKVLDKVTDQLAAEFRRGGHFANVAVVEDFVQRPPAATPVGEPLETFRDADSLDAPLRTAADLAEFDRQRAAAARRSATPATLVVVSQVIDYTKGNKLLQLLFLDLGNAVMTLRFSYLDKATGEELGRSVITSDDSSKVIPSLLSPRSALSGVAEGLADQVTRRKVAGER